MAEQTTVGKLLLRKAVPSHLHRALPLLDNADKGKVKKFFQYVADTNPNDYSDVLFRVKQVGDRVATEHGSSFSLNEFTSPVNKRQLVDRLKSQITSIQSARGTKADKENKIAELLSSTASKLTKDVVEGAVKRGDVLGEMVSTGARGKPVQLNSMVGAPLLYTDHNNKPIMVPVVKSYAEGLDPHEYWTASYGARRGVLSEKFSVRDAGYMGKQFSRAMNTLIITADDCGVNNGVMESVKDTDNVGRYLARPEGRYPRNTLITAEVLSNLKNKKEIMIRSPLTCEAEKGVCKYCTGIVESNKLPELGANVGVNAAASMAEPITQMALNVKHTGGVSGGSSGISGFKLIKQLITIPKTFTHGAVLSEEDGTITDIREAPQGGYYIKVNDTKHYIHPTLNIEVKKGDRVEAGDALTDGIVNPADVTRLKGIGQGRRYLAHKLRDTMLDNGIKVWKPNFDLVAKNMINHVQVQDPDGLGEALPDDIVEYSSSLVPENKVKDTDLKKAIGKYLGQNALHFTVGTKIKPSVIEELKKAGISNVKVLEDPPSFVPVMFRSQDIPSLKTDWMAQMGASNLKKNLLNALTRGAKSRYHGINVEPALAYGVEFGRPPGGTIGY